MNSITLKENNVPKKNGFYFYGRTGIGVDATFCRIIDTGKDLIVSSQGCVLHISHYSNNNYVWSDEVVFSNQ